LKKIKSIVLGVLLIVSILAIVNPVSAATLEVGPGKTYATINAAIGAAGNGDTILVYPGTYTENITINKSLTLQGVDKDATIVKPSASADEWITINASNVHLKNLTFDGSGYNIGRAITTRGGSGSVTSCVIKNIKQNQYIGIGIRVWHETSGQRWTISGNKFQNIERIGIYVGGQDNIATISNNILEGNGEGNWLQYGVEVGRSGQANIENNHISKYQSDESGWESAGILVTAAYGPKSTAYIMGNTVVKNKYGVYIGYVSKDKLTDDSIVTLKCNTIFDNTYNIKKVGGATVNELPCLNELPMNKFVSIFKKNFEKNHGKSENSNNIEN